MPRSLINTRTQRAIATDVLLAVTRRARRRGLLGSEALAPARALMLAPCVAIHTAFMRFPIDAVFLDRGGRVLQLVFGLRPWRIRVCVRSYAVVEMAGGSVQTSDIAVGDYLCLTADGCEADGARGGSC